MYSPTENFILVFNMLMINTSELKKNKKKKHATKILLLYTKTKSRTGKKCQMNFPNFKQEKMH